MIKKCQSCTKVFNARLNRYKFCSPKCSGKARSGKNNCNWVGGRPELTCLSCGKIFLGYTYRISKYCSQECCGKAKIKGVEAGKYPIHSWIQRRKPKPNACEECGKINCLLDLSNKDHKYSRNLEDYRYLCRSCHRKFDIKHNNYLHSILLPKSQRPKLSHNLHSQ